MFSGPGTDTACRQCARQRKAASASWVLSATAVLYLYAVGGVLAQVAVVADPPLLQMRADDVPRVAGMATPAGPAMASTKSFDLSVSYIDSKLYNPGTGQYDNVRLRGYVGAPTDSGAPYVAPTIEAQPGDTVNLTLHNQLPADPSCSGMTMEPNSPHCFNGTNMHTHGLWISPAGNSDNVLLSINPGVNFQYEYNIPQDHPAGTFWYHPHRHGSTALQVSSGMAGALIIRGNRLPTASGHGDIDMLLKGPGDQALAERVLVLQQIQYACLDADGNIKVRKNANGRVVDWVCDPGDVGGIESYSDKNGNGFGPGSWAESGRYTSVNGLILPTFQAQAGAIERWRLIHAGVRDTIAIQFLPLRSGAASVAGLEASAADQFIGENCGTDPLPYQVIASDGLTMAAAQQKTIEVLQPGYRIDALVVFPNAGRYCVVNAAIPAPASVSRSAEPRRLLGIVDVAPGTPVTDVRSHVVNGLVAAAGRVMPAEVRQEVIDDLQAGFKLTQFTPHPDVGDAEVTGQQHLTFFIDTSSPDTRFEVSSDAFDMPFDPKPYEPARVDRVLTLGDVDEWQMQSRFGSHPFHIHVNPFQIVKILDPNGKDVSAADTVDDADGQTPDPQYSGLKGVWKDTIWIKSLADPDSYPKGVYTIVMRTRYQRYVGEYVLHCHILDHEDQGMMQNVLVGIPDGQGGTSGMH